MHGRRRPWGLLIVAVVVAGSLGIVVTLELNGAPWGCLHD